MARVLTFLFTDLVGSTELLARLGESRAEIVRRSYFGLVRDAVGASGGRELKSLGDGVMVAFESPSDAVACAVAMQRAFGRHNARSGDRLDVRIGLQVGETVEVDAPYEHEDYFGGPVVEARKLCEAALGGQILASALVRALAEPHSAYPFAPMGLLELRGLPEAVAAFEVIYEQAAREQLPLPPELGPAPTGGSEFVGRAGPWETLHDAWRRTETGERQLALISGEPGIGKTRLAAEFARNAYGAGGVVLWGRCFEEALAPYQPFVEALRHYVTTCEPDELGGRMAKQVAPLARLLPELATRLPAVVPDVGAEPEAERFRLFEAIAALLAQIASEAPLLLVLDDLQWADSGSLLLLRNLLLDPRPASMLVVGTYRDSEIARSHPFAQVRADLLRDRPVALIELDGLSDEETSTLVESLLGWTLPPDVARALQGETDGNPFFLEEVVRHLEDLGVVSDPERLRRVATSADELGVPRRVRELVARRVQRLSPGAIVALRMAAVIGAEFRLDLLSAVMDAHEQDVVALLDEAIEARLVTEVPTRIGSYSFSHALIRQALYDEQTTNRRAALHAHIAETLESLMPDAAAALALHFSLAGDRYLARVVGYARSAGERALELLAYEDAVREFQRSLSALALVGGSGTNEYAELLLLLGAAESRAGGPGEAAAAFEEAAEIAVRTGAAATLARAALGYGGGTGFGGVWTKFARVDAPLVHFLEQALAMLPADDTRMRVQLLARLAQALYWGSEDGRASALSEEALRLARALDEPIPLAHALDSRHVALWQPDNLEELRPLAEEMLRIGAACGDREIQLQAHAWLITDALERAPIEIVDQYIDAHARLARELRQPYHLWYTDVARAMRAHLDGRFTEMAEALERSWQYGRTAHSETAESVLGVQSFHLKLDTGAVAEAIAPLEQLAAVSPLPAVQAVLARAYAAQGRRDEALARIKPFADGEFAAIRRDCVWSSTACYIADVVARFDVVEHAPALYRLLVPLADRNCVAGGAILCLGPISRFLGMLARVTGDHERALQHLRHALARSRALGALPLVASTHLEAAKVLLARGDEDDHARAADALTEAIAVAEPLGMPQVQADACDLLRTIEQPVAAVRA